MLPSISSYKVSDQNLELIKRLFPNKEIPISLQSDNNKKRSGSVYSNKDSIKSRSTSAYVKLDELNISDGTVSKSKSASLVKSSKKRRSVTTQDTNTINNNKSTSVKFSPNITAETSNVENPYDQVSDSLTPQEPDPLFQQLTSGAFDTDLTLSDTTTPSHNNRNTPTSHTKDLTRYTAYNIHFIRKCMIRTTTINRIQEVLYKLDNLLPLIDMQSTGVILYENFYKLLITIIPKAYVRPDLKQYLIGYAPLDSIIEYKDILYNGKISIIKMTQINSLFPSLSGWINRQIHYKEKHMERAKINWSTHVKWLNLRFMDTLRQLLHIGDKAIRHIDKQNYTLYTLFHISKRYIAIDSLIYIGQKYRILYNKRTVAYNNLVIHGQKAINLLTNQYKAKQYLYHIASIILVNKKVNTYQTNYDKIYKITYDMNKAYLYLIQRSQLAIQHTNKQYITSLYLYKRGQNSVSVVAKWEEAVTFLQTRGDMAKKRLIEYDNTTLILQQYGIKYIKHTNIQYNIYNTFLSIRGEKYKTHINKQNQIYQLHSTKLRPHYITHVNKQYHIQIYLTKIGQKSLKLEYNQYIAQLYLLGKIHGYFTREDPRLEVYSILCHIGQKAIKHTSMQYDVCVPYLQVCSI